MIRGGKFVRLLAPFLSMTFFGSLVKFSYYHLHHDRSQRRKYCASTRYVGFEYIFSCVQSNGFALSFRILFFFFFYYFNFTFMAG